MQSEKDIARLPHTLDLAAFVGSLVEGMAGRKPDYALADELQVTAKTIHAWQDAQRTNHGPSIHITTDNFLALCAEGRRQGRNMELFCSGPAVWEHNARVPLPPAVRIGKSFKSHGVKLGGLLLDSPLILTGGVLSDHEADIRWCLDTGFSGVETKTRLSHQRYGRTQDQIVSLSELPALEPSDHPRLPASVMTQGFERELSGTHGLGVRLGAPSSSAPAWMSETDGVLSKLKGGEQLLLSIGAHVPRMRDSLDKAAILEDWERVARYAARTNALIVVANVSCNAFNDYYEDLQFVAEVALIVRKILKNQKLFLKLSYLPEKQLEHLLLCVDRQIDGVVALNCEPGIACSIDLEGQKAPTWGERDSRIGIAGPPLFPLNKAFVQQFVKLRGRHLPLRHLNLIACGGVYHTHQVSELLNMGADCVGVNSAMFQDSFFGLKARRYIDSEWDRRRTRISQESGRIREIWNVAYELEVESVPLDAPGFDVLHRNAMNLLDQLLLESRSRIGRLETAAAGGKRVETMGLPDMREIIRQGF